MFLVSCLPALKLFGALDGGFYGGFGDGAEGAQVWIRFHGGLYFLVIVLSSLAGGFVAPASTMYWVTKRVTQVTSRLDDEKNS